LAERENFDVVIIGGGPAGVSAAVWCADLGLSAVVLEREREPFGQLRWIHNPIANYLGVRAQNGAELIERFEETARLWGVRIDTGAVVESVDCKRRVVTLAGGRGEIAGRALFLATGIRRRTLGVPGEDRFVGKGILRSGAGERENVKGKRVVVVGGGDAAAENALLLAEFARRVHLVHRRDRLAARPEFYRAVESSPNIETIFESEIVELVGGERLEKVDIKGPDGSVTRLPVDHFIARIGVAPNSEIVAGQLDLDPAGYILVDAESRTSVHAIYGLGDVANPTSPTISTATGTAATAAKSVFTLLTAQKSI
jgi:thioredoxin reductase (NADPH)